MRIGCEKEKMRIGIRKENSEIRMLKENKEDLGYQVFDWNSGNKDSCIHIIKDHYGYINEAMWKIQARYRRELAEVQKAIDEL